MVRALLENRKTQTRRVVRGPALQWLTRGYGPDFVANPDNGLCPYGFPPERLWVREAWFPKFPVPEREHVLYRATEPELEHLLAWRRSIYMPRWASRITLELTQVRVQHLQEISKEDTRAEGIEGLHPDSPLWSLAFASEWDALNPKSPWASDPWVFAMTFRKMDGG